ncbi:hypothetical protein [Hymenobacter jeollabukensis]|uniref:Uncharacterized protein n=1 Tax=Hymenobacter jeollabukensis TaxID=2025313 RepID=A0A5R8WRG4_9BACT|nr:hypothetical protein [Hymenobacter jeollabukensis]TLM93325.1 hypothetical protein FDY95_11950 [Hymenobacter jeollabukensis]
MDFDYTVRKLEQQYRNVDNGDTEVWLKTTHSFIIEHFGPLAPRARNFADLVHDYQIKKITGIEPKDIVIFKNKALEYIENNISYLNEAKQREREKLLYIKNTEANSKVKPTNIPDIKTTTNTVTKTQLPLGMSAELFWTLFSGCIVAAFFIGQLFGGAKFDKEKSDYYDEIKNLKANQKGLNKIISKNTIDMHYKDKRITILRDSIKNISKDLNNLYLYIGNLQEKK